MPSRSSACPLIACSVTLACVLAGRSALASDNAVVKTTGNNVEGQVNFKTMTIKAGGSVTVTGSTFPASAELHLAKLVIEPGGLIDASTFGYKGVEDAAGDGPNAGNGGQLGAADPSPGGGGANFADGGPGTLGTGAGCSLFGGAAGTFFGSLPAGSPGSSGGAVLSSTATLPTRGGAGGGILTIRAAEVVVDGAIRADGESPTVNVNNVGRSGGGGGSILIFAWKITGTGTISAQGGSGGKGSAGNGGGGGGGSIQISAVQNLFTGTLKVDGGTSGDCTTLGGGMGVIAQTTLPGTCIDVDGDLHEAAVCGGDDCDDSDPKINPDIVEACDGIDNDCSGTADDNLPPDACAGGLVCDNGACVSPNDGGPPPDAGQPDAGTPPDHVDFVGGACSFDPVPFLGCSGAAAAFVTGLGVSLLGRRRRPKKHARG